MNQETIQKYEELAKRNGWKFFVQDNRPYFYSQEGGYAIPDKNTSLSDKELLANIIAEGSDEMEKLIIKCWDNDIKISGPCSGIREFHENPPMYLHFAFIGPVEIIEPLHVEIESAFPNFNDYYRDPIDGIVRYDVSYILEGKELTKEESNAIFKVISEKLDIILDMYKEVKPHM